MKENTLLKINIIPEKLNLTICGRFKYCFYCSWMHIKITFFGIYQVSGWNLSRDPEDQNQTDT